jgi:hypothetical protein
MNPMPLDFYSVARFEVFGDEILDVGDATRWWWLRAAAAAMTRW